MRILKNTEKANCIECNKTFLKRTKAGVAKRVKKVMRSNAKTCSSKCARVYASKKRNYTSKKVKRKE